MLTHRSASRSCPNTANGRQEVEADLECGAAASQLWNGGLGSADYAVRGRPETAHLSRCGAVQRRPANRTHSRHSGSGAGTGLHAPFRTSATRAPRSIGLVESGPSHSLRFVQLMVKGLHGARQFRNRPAYRCAKTGVCEVICRL